MISLKRRIPQTYIPFISAQKYSATHVALQSGSVVILPRYNAPHYNVTQHTTQNASDAPPQNCCYNVIDIAITKYIQQIYGIYVVFYSPYSCSKNVIYLLAESDPWFIQAWK